jgi:hypothetical protein
MEHHIGDMGNTGDENAQGQGYSFDASVMVVDSHDPGSFDNFCSLGHEGQPVGLSTSDPDLGFEHVLDSAFGGSSLLLALFQSTDKSSIRFRLSWPYLK